MAKITNKEEFEKWLWNQNQPVLIVVSVRTALRVFPFVLDTIPEHTDKSDTKSLALLTARALLASAVAGNAPTADVKLAAHSAHTTISTNLALLGLGIVIGNESDTKSRSVVISHDATALSANFARSAAAYAAETAAASAIATVIVSLDDSAANLARNTTLTVAYSDANSIIPETAAGLLETPIWGDEQFEGVIKSAWNKFLKNTLPKNPEFTFWHDWYQGFLDGKPLDWNLQREVALIPDADWEKGPAHIANLIGLIWDRYKLKEQVKKLEALLPEDKKSRHGIGGNNPPPQIGDITSPEQIISISYSAIDILKGEIEETEPDKTRLQWAINALGRVLKAIGKYGIILSDVFIKSGTAAAGVKYGEDIIKSVIEHATNWYNHLP